MTVKKQGTGLSEAENINAAGPSENSEVDVVDPEEYDVIDPEANYRGKSYSEWITEWFNWFVSANADQRNSGPVVFLRSKSIPKKSSDAENSDELNQFNGTTTDEVARENFDSDYPKAYRNDPNIRIGSNRLQIFTDQVVLVPLIVAFKIKTDLYQDYGYLQDFTGLLIDAGDDPPDLTQLTINAKEIHLGKNKNGKDRSMDQFRFSTPIFTAVIPEAPYGISMKDFIEEGPVPPGVYPAIAEGYFVMVKFPELGKGKTHTYVIHSWASAGREARGPYFSELIYEVETCERRERHKRVTSRFPARNESLLLRALTKKEKDGDISKQTIDKVKKMKEFATKSLV